MPSSGYRGRDFRLLWGGETVSEVGSQVSLLALPLVAVTTLNATVFQVGLLTASQTAAFLLVGLPAGAWVDRLRHRPVMIVADVGRAFAFGSIPAAAAWGSLTMVQLYVVALVCGVLTVFFDVAYQSILPSLVGRDGLVAANARLGGSQEVAHVAGPSLAGWLVQLVGAPYAVAVDAGSFLVSGAAIGAIDTDQAPPARAGPRRGALRREIMEGLRFVLGHRTLRAIAGTTSTANLFGSVVAAVQIVFLVRVVHLHSGEIGLLLAGGSVGGVLGALVASPLARVFGSAKTTIGAIVVSSLGVYLYPLARPGPWVALFSVGFFLEGFGAVVYNVNQVSFRQALCPPELLGRMNATMRFIVWGTMPLGGLLGGVLGGAIGIRPTMWLAAAGATTAVVWLLASPMRSVRDYHVEPGDFAGDVVALEEPDPLR
ncbi:MAG TPA: MFS transporter [Acidimicrobiales bacterium]|nr:MFS transporter [Acidimicrobiales bacterium]